MAQCSQCKAETELYYGGVPICPECADAKEDKNPTFWGQLETRSSRTKERSNAA
jgi:hypothetical protein